ncbi:MAG: butyrate kinase, partial [Lachnospiraceae bacterium]|nr:butyrate kinase [Lachnospiraceae bacterium]
TGGIAYSEMFTNMIKERVEFIAPVIIYPGENEMQSLALGGLRVLRGEEEAKVFKKVVK